MGEEIFVEIDVADGTIEGNGECKGSTDVEGAGVSEGFLSCLSPGGNDRVIAPDQTITTARMAQAINFMLNRMLFPQSTRG